MGSVRVGLAPRARRLEAALAHAVLDLGDRGLEHPHPRPPFGVALHQLPAGGLVAGARQHVLHGQQVLGPLLAVAPVLFGELPALERDALTALEAPQLLLVGDCLLYTSPSPRDGL